MEMYVFKLNALHVRLFFFKQDLRYTMGVTFPSGFPE